MIKSILLFIKAHTIATAITTTVVVSTVVATPIIINQVQKPEQEIETGQVQENIIDNTVIDNTVVDSTETPEENTIDENTTVPEEEQKEENKNQETTKPTTSSSNTSTTKPTTPSTTTNNNKTETPSQPSTPTQSTQKKIVSFNDRAKITYNETDKTISFNTGYQYKDIPKDKFFSTRYYNDVKQFQEPIETAIYQDQHNGIYNKDYCQSKIAEYTAEVYRYQGALEYLKLHENDIQSISNANNEFLYQGKYYSNYSGTLEGCIRVASQNKADWEQNLKTAPQYRT